MGAGGKSVRGLFSLLSSACLFASCHNLDLDHATAQGGSAGQAAQDGGSAGQAAQDGGSAGYLNDGSAGYAGEPQGGEAGTSPIHTGGDSGSAGSEANTPDGGTEDVVLPSCIMHDSNPPISFQAPASLAVSLSFSGQPFVVYATQPSSNSMTMRWSLGTGFDSSWYAWTCLDSLRQPQRTAAANLSGFGTEVYVTTKSGALFVRHLFTSIGWAPWESHPLPSANSHADDVATVGRPSSIPFLYVIDRARVFVRHRANSSEVAQYLPWAEVKAPPSPQRISAGIRLDGRQQVFIVDATGSAFTSIQTSALPDAGFGAFERFGDESTPTLSEIQCGYLENGSLTVFGLSAGAVWSRSLSGNAWGAWTPEPGQGALTLLTLAVGSWFGQQSPIVFGTDADSPAPRLWHHVIGSSVWAQIQ